MLAYQDCPGKQAINRVSLSVITSAKEFVFASFFLCWLICLYGVRLGLGSIRSGPVVREMETLHYCTLRGMYCNEESHSLLVWKIPLQEYA